MIKQNLGITATDFEGAYLLDPFYLEDNRGSFAKNFEKGFFQEAGLDSDISEEFETYSSKNVIRGLHFQTRFPQGKIVRCVSGEIYDVIVDLRKNSKTFGHWRGFDLTSENHQSLIVPKGCAHGFLVRSENALVSYICTGKYYREYDTGIKWNDSTLNIDWPIDSKMDVISSEKDSGLQSFKEFISSYGGF